MWARGAVAVDGVNAGRRQRALILAARSAERGAPETAVILLAEGKGEILRPRQKLGRADVRIRKDRAWKSSTSGSERSGERAPESDMSRPGRLEVSIDGRSVVSNRLPAIQADRERRCGSDQRWKFGPSICRKQFSCGQRGKR